MKQFLERWIEPLTSRQDALRRTHPKLWHLSTLYVAAFAILGSLGTFTVASLLPESPQHITPVEPGYFSLLVACGLVLLIWLASLLRPISWQQISHPGAVPSLTLLALHAIALTLPAQVYGFRLQARAERQLDPKLAMLARNLITRYALNRRVLYDLHLKRYSPILNDSEQKELDQIIDQFDKRDTETGWAMFEPFIRSNVYKNHHVQTLNLGFYMKDADGTDGHASLTYYSQSTIAFDLGFASPIPRFMSIRPGYASNIAKARPDFGVIANTSFSCLNLKAPVFVCEGLLDIDNTSALVDADFKSTVSKVIDKLPFATRDPLERTLLTPAYEALAQYLKRILDALGDPPSQASISNDATTQSNDQNGVQRLLDGLYLIEAPAHQYYCGWLSRSVNLAPIALNSTDIADLSDAATNVVMTAMRLTLGDAVEGPHSPWLAPAPHEDLALRNFLTGIGIAANREQDQAQRSLDVLESALYAMTGQRDGGSFSSPQAQPSEVIDELYWFPTKFAVLGSLFLAASLSIAFGTWQVVGADVFMQSAWGVAIAVVIGAAAELLISSEPVNIFVSSVLFGLVAGTALLAAANAYWGGLTSWIARVLATGAAIGLPAIAIWLLHLGVSQKTIFSYPNHGGESNDIRLFVFIVGLVLMLIIGEFCLKALRRMASRPH